MTSSSKGAVSFNELCYELFTNNVHGKFFITELEKMLKYPVAIAGKDICFTWMNEGRNDFIRMMINGSNLFMQEKLNAGKTPNTNRTRTRTRK